MHYLIIIFGDLTLLAGMLIMVKPDIIFDFLKSNFERKEYYILAILIRLVLGGVMIYTAELSNFPAAIEIIGWVSLAAGLAAILMGHGNFNRLVAWALSLLKPYGRLGGLMAALFGAFLVLSFV